MSGERLNSDQKLFFRTVRDFCTKELLPQIDQWEADEYFPDWIFKKAGDLGIFGAHYAEEHGGSGGDYWWSVAKAEALPHCGAAGITMALLVQSDMATPCIADLGTKEQIDEFLRPALAGERIAALGVTEPDAGSDVASIRTIARRVGDEYVISGAKTYITNGCRASFVTLLCKTDPQAGHQGISIILLPTDVKGFSMAKKLKKLGNHCSDTAELAFDECRVPARYLLGEEGQGFYYLMQNFQTERLSAAISAVAGAQRTIDLSLSYGRDRKAFGKPIIARELWQHEFAEMQTRLEAARQLSYHAAECYNRERYEQRTPLSFDTVKKVSMAKLFVGDVVDYISDRCLQFHGGMGYMDETFVSRAWQDSRLLRIGGGTSEVMRYHIAKLLGLGR